MNSAVGDTLRRERIKRNLQLDAVSRELKISLKFLEAIETDDFDKLPGGVFARSFVRQYAAMLGLDQDELAAEVQRVMEPPPLLAHQGEPALKEAKVDLRSRNDIPVPRMEAWQSVSDRRFSWSSPLPALALVVVVMMVCSGVYAWWQRQRLPVTARADSPAAAVAIPPAPATQPAAVPAETAPTPSTVPAPPPADASPSPVPPNPAGEAQRTASAVIQSANGVHVQVTADETVWVLAQSDGKYLFSGTLEPNQTRTVDASGAVVLRLGNAGGVTITLNGKPIGNVGPKGQVRTVQLTSGGFQIVAAPPKPSLPLDDIL